MMQICATLPPETRLHRPEEFSAVLKRRPSAKGKLLTISWLPSQTSPARLGLVVGKRQAPLSVTRNAVKRVVREAFRLERNQLKWGDYVVRLQSSARNRSLTELKKSVRQEINILLGQFH
jgi:ribonuclease P protein component